MSSDMPRFTLSALSSADPPGQQRLHSRGYAVCKRLAALLVLLSLFRLGHSQSLVETAVHASLAFALASLLWFRNPTVVATRSGLALGSGRRTRLIPWARVHDVRELPWIRVSPPWYPKMWQVDLSDGERFDFCGVRDARQIVIEFVKRNR